METQRVEVPRTDTPVADALEADAVDAETVDAETSYAQLPRPAWRGGMHAIAFFAAIPLGVLLILSAHRAAARVAASVYVFSVLAGFGTSAAYHRIAQSVESRRTMRRLDHAMIFILIAGTYTPVALLGLPRTWGIPILAVVATGAIAGFVIKLTAFDRFRWMSFALYPILGWAAVIALPVMAGHTGAATVTLVVAGGLFYTAGLPILIKRRPDPWPATFGYHEIWHTFTVLAGVCHFAAVALLVTC